MGQRIWGIWALLVFVVVGAVLAAIAERGYYLQLPPNLHAPHVTFGG